jgi:hypothetical protein
VGADLRPGVLTGLLDLLGVLDTELPGGLQRTLLALGSRELPGSEILQELRDGRAALLREDAQPV